MDKNNKNINRTNKLCPKTKRLAGYCVGFLPPCKAAKRSNALCLASFDNEAGRQKNKQEVKAFSFSGMNKTIATVLYIALILCSVLVSTNSTVPIAFGQIETEIPAGHGNTQYNTYALSSAAVSNAAVFDVAVSDVAVSDVADTAFSNAIASDTAASNPADRAPSNEGEPSITGMFVVPDLVAPGDTAGKIAWGQAHWSEALSKLKAVGMDKVVIQYSAQYWSSASKFSYYPETAFAPFNGNQPGYQRQQISYALAAAKENNMKVHMGLQLSEDLWFTNMAAGFSDLSFLTASAQFSVDLAQDLWALYSGQYADTIAGWYIPFELNNREVGADAAQTMISHYFAPVADYLKTMTPNKPIMISPFIISGLTETPAQEELDVWRSMCAELWKNTRLDIIAVQDGCGWEWNTKETLAPWYQALADAKDEAGPIRAAKGWSEAIIWNNAESYSMNGVNPMPTKRLIENINAVKGYVSDTVSFSLHYFVPLEDANACGLDSDNQKYYDAYDYVYEHGSAFTPSSPIPAITGGQAAVTGYFDVTLEWNPISGPQVEMPVAGYVVKRKLLTEPDMGAIKIAEVRQPDSGRVVFTDCQLDSGTAYEYLIYPFDATGNRSPEPGRIEAVIPPVGIEINRSYGGDIAYGLTFSRGGSSNVRTYHNTEALLTDGQKGALISDWGADSLKWFGFEKSPGSGQCSVSLSVYEPSQRLAGFLYVNALYQPDIGISLPDKIEVFLDSGQVAVAVVFPKTEYADPVRGDIWIPIDLGGALAFETLRIQIFQTENWTYLSEIRIHEAEKTPFANATEPQNLAHGLTVRLSGYSPAASVDPESHFRGIKETKSNGWGGYYSDYVMLNGNYATKLLTRNGNSPPIGWWEDSTQSHWQGVWNATTNYYEMSLHFAEPVSFNAVGSLWLEDKNASIYIPSRVEYYARDAQGALTLLGSANKGSAPQLDWTLPLHQNYQHKPMEKGLWVIKESAAQYNGIVVRVYPEYHNQWAFVRSISVYNTV